MHYRMGTVGCCFPSRHSLKGVISKPLWAKLPLKSSDHQVRMCVCARTPGSDRRPFLCVWTCESRDQSPGTSWCFLLRVSAVTPTPKPHSTPRLTTTGLPQTQEPDPGHRGHQSLVGVRREDGHLHERTLPFSEYEEGKERCGDTLLSSGATEGRKP